MLRIARLARLAPQNLGGMGSRSRSRREQVEARSKVVVVRSKVVVVRSRVVVLVVLRRRLIQ